MTAQEARALILAYELYRNKRHDPRRRKAAMSRPPACGAALGSGTPGAGLCALRTMSTDPASA